MAVINLTEARIRSLPLGSGIWRDEQVKGLMVLCHRTTRTFAVQGDVRRNGRHVRTVRVKIDRCDRIGLREARRRARELMSKIQSGVDPTDGPEETGITLERALDAHLAERELRPRTERDYRYHLDKHLKHLRRRAVADISRQDCRELLDTLTTRHGRTTASGALRTLRALINTAMRIDETIAANPVDAVRVPVPAITPGPAARHGRLVVEDGRADAPDARPPPRVPADRRAPDLDAERQAGGRGPRPAGPQVHAHEDWRRIALPTRAGGPQRCSGSGSRRTGR